MQLSKFFGHTPEFRATSQGVVLGCAVGWIVCELANLPEVLFFLLTIVSMGLLGLGYAAHDAMRANSGKPPIALRAHFYRGLAEAGIGFLLMLAIESVRAAI